MIHLVREGGESNTKNWKSKHTLLGWGLLDQEESNTKNWKVLILVDELYASVAENPIQRIESIHLKRQSPRTRILENPIQRIERVLVGLMSIVIDRDKESNTKNWKARLKRVWSGRNQCVWIQYKELKGYCLKTD